MTRCFVVPGPTFLHLSLLRHVAVFRFLNFLRLILFFLLFNFSRSLGCFFCDVFFRNTTVFTTSTFSSVSMWHCCFLLFLFHVFLCFCWFIYFWGNRQNWKREVVKIGKCAIGPFSFRLVSVRFETFWLLIQPRDDVLLLCVSTECSRIISFRLSLLIWLSRLFKQLRALW